MVGVEDVGSVSGWMVDWFDVRAYVCVRHLLLCDGEKQISLGQFRLRVGMTGWLREMEF